MPLELNNLIVQWIFTETKTRTISTKNQTSPPSIQPDTQFNPLFNIGTTLWGDKTPQYHPTFRTPQHWQLKQSSTYFGRVESISFRSSYTNWIHKPLKTISIFIIENTNIRSLTSIHTFSNRIHLLPINQPTKPWNRIQANTIDNPSNRIINQSIKQTKRPVNQNEEMNR